jgi:hypothetical protein
MAPKVKATEERTRTEDPAPLNGAVGGSEALWQQIQLRAYYRYCTRGCAPGADVEDWLAAEQELSTGQAEQVSPAADGSAA